MKLLTHIAIGILFLTGSASTWAQPGPPSPAPGVLPPPASQLPPPAPAPGENPPPPPANPLPPQTPPPAGWASAGYLSNLPLGSLMNQGTLNVMATGYDTESVLVQIPLQVSYSFNGANYDVMVINAWSPFTQTWNMGVDTQAFQTSYYFNGFTYNYYANLPSGTYYFNL